jgi:hypothetical protein
MTVQAVQPRCRKCGTRLVTTIEQACIICGFPTEEAAKLAASPAIKLAPKPVAARPPAVFYPSVKEAIVKSYETAGLVQTAEQFGIKPSTLVLRLRKWGVALHGRGWKPGQAQGENGKLHGGGEVLHPFESPVSRADMGETAVFDVLGNRLGELEQVVVRAVDSCGKAVREKSYQAGRLEMLQTIKVMVKQMRESGDGLKGS